MNFDFLNGLPDQHRSELTRALLNDAFLVPVAEVMMDRQTAETRISYLHSTVDEVDYLPLFSDVKNFAALDLPCAGTVQPPLSVLHESVGELLVVIDLGIKSAFTTTLKSLVALQRSTHESARSGKGR